MEVLAKLEETGIPCPGPSIQLKTMVAGRRWVLLALAGQELVEATTSEEQG